MPAKVEVIDEAGVHFNHGGPIFHDHAGRLLVLPSLLDIEMVEREREQGNLSNENHGEEGSCWLGSNGEHLNANERDCGRARGSLVVEAT